MPTTAPSSTSRTRVLLAGASWALLFIGVFVMHGVSSHGATTHAPPSAVELVGATHSAGHNGEDKPVAGHAPQHGADDDEAGGHSAAEFCLAILIGLLSVLAAMLVATRLRRALFEVPRHTAMAVVASWLRDPDPPCLYRLSIQRC